MADQSTQLRIIETSSSAYAADQTLEPANCAQKVFVVKTTIPRDEFVSTFFSLFLILPVPACTNQHDKTQSQGCEDYTCCLPCLYKFRRLRRRRNASKDLNSRREELEGEHHRMKDLEASYLPPTYSALKEDDYGVSMKAGDKVVDKVDGHSVKLSANAVEK
jgi:hypothetical protein